jgi:RNA polymerase sigma factor (sigma-70 family)
MTVGVDAGEAEHVTDRDVHRAIDAVWRIESPKVVAGLMRIVGDLAAAEDLAQDALMVALERWPESGIPRRPGAWLMATAKHRAYDLVRRRSMMGRKHEEIGYALETEQADSTPDYEAEIDDDIGDDLLRLMFVSCHPVLTTDARVSLTLRLLGGLTTAEIARAFLAPESTIAQRIVRAKKTIAEARVPFEVPRGDDRAERLGSVLEVIYLVFNEGYSATAGDDYLRPELCEDALRLGRVLATLAPEEPEVHGLVALMELHASRIRARTAPDGSPILLMDQDRGRWDRVLITRGLQSLRRIRELGGAFGPYGLQAGIASCHAIARTPEETDWQRIVALYDALAQIAPSPVVELNRAVAVSRAYGDEEGLAALDERAAPYLEGYHLLPAARGDLLERLGRTEEAAYEFDRAAELTRNERERVLLAERARACRSGGA